MYFIIKTKQNIKPTNSDCVQQGRMKMQVGLYFCQAYQCITPIAYSMRARLFRVVRSAILVVFPVTVLFRIHTRFFRILAFSNPAHSYFNFPYLRLPSLRSRTWIFRTWIFHPYTFCHFVLQFSVLAFSSTCNFSAPFSTTPDRLTLPLQGTPANIRTDLTWYIARK